MRNQGKTKEQLLHELMQSKHEIRELKNLENDQKKIFDTLQLERELYADLANALPSGIYRTRVFKDVPLVEDKWLSSKDAPYVVEYANDRFFDILHLDRVSYEKNPASLHDLIFEDDKAGFARANVESNLHTTPFSWEGRFSVSDNLIWIHFKSIPRVMDNGDVIWTGTLDDITVRKQIEEEIKFNNAELQKLNTDKDIFMSILAHDLISPFNSILGYLDLLGNNLREYDIDKIEKQITVVNHAAFNAFHLLEDMLIWARSQSGKLPFEPGEFHFQVICDQMVDMLKPNASLKNITIDFVETEKIIVFADINMLNTILRNLISNAIKFTHKGGRIKIGAKQDERGVTISVSDNGMGIAPEFLSKLFDIKLKYSSKGTANEKGTGLGLLLCKDFVEKHSGNIWVESELGKGSVFAFTLPLNSACS